MNKRGVMNDFVDFMFTIVAGIILFLFLGFFLSTQFNSRDAETLSVLKVNQRVDGHLVFKRLNPPQITEKFNPEIWAQQLRNDIDDLRTFTFESYVEAELEKEMIKLRKEHKQ